MIAILCLFLKRMRGLATLTILLSTRLQRYIISLKNKVEYSISSLHYSFLRKTRSVDRFATPLSMGLAQNILGTMDSSNVYSAFFHRVKDLIQNEGLESAKNELNLIDKSLVHKGPGSFVIKKYGITLPKADYYYERSMLLSFFPNEENDALEAFCYSNRYQVELDNASSHKTINKQYYSFRRPNEYSYSDLTNNAITLVSPKRMNDPFDTLMYPWLEYRRSSCSNLKEGLSAIEMEAMERANRLFIKSQDHYRIRSFCFWAKTDTKAPFKNPAMWSHYAQEHRGFCVIYSLSENMSLHSGDKDYRIMEKMDYRDSVSLDKLLDGKVALLTKSEDWKTENEFRLLMYDPSIKDEYYQLPLDSNSYVSGIIFGLKCEESTKSIVRNLLAGHSVSYYQMEIDYEDVYSMKCIRI